MPQPNLDDAVLRAVETLRVANLGEVKNQAARPSRR